MTKKWLRVVCAVSALLVFGSLADFVVGQQWGSCLQVAILQGLVHLGLPVKLAVFMMFVPQILALYFFTWSMSWLQKIYWAERRARADRLQQLQNIERRLDGVRDSLQKLSQNLEERRKTVEAVVNAIELRIRPWRWN